jgi:hypothetical protein
MLSLSNGVVVVGGAVDVGGLLLIFVIVISEFDLVVAGSSCCCSGCCCGGSQNQPSPVSTSATGTIWSSCRCMTVWNLKWNSFNLVFSLPFADLIIVFIHSIFCCEWLLIYQTLTIKFLFLPASIKVLNRAGTITILVFFK